TELAERSGASLRTLSLADTDRLIAEASTGVDLLVIGSRRRHGLAGRLLLDGPALRLTRTAPCPILIVPTT
ncbi:MAG TPA: universal stress protein, partial [Solirubrobacterales bacterium]|nr:universal stress protein [Solirubrobacterales bacterium]